ncbi:MAG: DNA-binding response regulator [Burkholderiales bacterium]|nr:MAG: DNA-binding response regulator [Burkholderiales bacterium]TAG83254.1 MAG: DNA-binding response regulator [Betaproteobacteria bacterium]
MTPIRCLIADDEPLMRERMRELLAEHSNFIEIVAEATNGDDALNKFNEARPDVCFLDIKMPVMTGLQVAAEIGDQAKIVFCTAYDQFAIQAFERGAVDYLLKPIESDRLKTTIDRLIDQVAMPPEDVTPVVHLINSREPRTAERLRWIKALVGHDVKMFPVDDVIFFQSDTKYTRVVTEAEDVLIRTSLKELLDGLDPEVFWQVHRGAIVNVNRITKITREGVEKHSLVLRGSEERIGVSRHFFHLFKQM